MDSESFLRSSDPEVRDLAERLRGIAKLVDLLGGGDMTSIVQVGQHNHATCAQIKRFLDGANFMAEEPAVLLEHRS